MPADTPEGTPAGERIAKVLSRAGVASRREAERMIETGQVSVNGKVIDSPALNVTPRDRITVNGAPLAPPEPARLWLYYKPEGLVTSAADEKGRDTVFDHLPEDMPRVMSVGRLDLNSEGLLLLTNDGELKRRLELPSTGWLRKYRVRVNGNPTDPDLDPLRKGIEVEGERFQPMEVKLDRVQGANAWLTVGLREGRNREIRRAMNAIGLYVNRLIRVSYGPFRLGELEPGDVEEVRPKVLRDQLGLSAEPADAPAKPAPRGRAPAKTPAEPARRFGTGVTTTSRSRQDGPGRSSATGAARTPPRGDEDVRPARGGKPAASKPGGPKSVGPKSAGPKSTGSKPGPAATGRTAPRAAFGTAPAEDGKPARKSGPKPAPKAPTRNAAPAGRGGASPKPDQGAPRRPPSGRPAGKPPRSPSRGPSRG